MSSENVLRIKLNVFLQIFRQYFICQVIPISKVFIVIDCTIQRKRNLSKRLRLDTMPLLVYMAILCRDKLAPWDVLSVIIPERILFSHI